MDLYFIKLGGSAFTHKYDHHKNEQFHHVLETYVREVMIPASNSLTEQHDRFLTELHNQIESMIKSDVILSFARALARWKASNDGQDSKSFVIILGGGSPAHGAVQVARSLRLNNKDYGTVVRLVVGYMSSLVTSLLARELSINYIPTSAWFYWEEEKEGQVTAVRMIPQPTTLHDHLSMGIHPVLGGDVILGKNGWSILSGDPIPYFLHRYWLPPSFSSSEQALQSWHVKETIMLSDIGVPSRHAGFYDSDPSNPSAQLVKKIVVHEERCIFELESGKQVEVPLSAIASDQLPPSGRNEVDVTGGMLQKIWWQVKLAQEGVDTRILDYRLFEKYIAGKEVPQTHITSARSGNYDRRG